MKPGLTDEQRERLQALLKKIDAAAERIDAARKPFDEAMDAIEDVREAWLEQHEVDIAGTCEGCTRIVFAGELGHCCQDGPTLCEACAPTWNDLRRQYDEAKERGEFADLFDDPEAARDSDELVDARIAAGDGDKRHVWPL